MRIPKWVLAFFVTYVTIKLWQKKKMYNICEILWCFAMMSMP